MKKVIVLMLALVLALSIFMFTACDDKDGNNIESEANIPGVILNENMSLEEALEAVRAESKYVGYTFYSEFYNKTGDLSLKHIFKRYYTDNFIYYDDSGYDESVGIYSELHYIDINEKKEYVLKDYEGKEIECFYLTLSDGDISNYRDEIKMLRDNAVQGFYTAMEYNVMMLETNCEESDENGGIHCTPMFEGTSLAFIGDCGACKSIDSDFNASYSIPEKYSNYKLIAKSAD